MEFCWLLKTYMFSWWLWHASTWWLRLEHLIKYKCYSFPNRTVLSWWLLFMSVGSRVWVNTSWSQFWLTSVICETMFTTVLTKRTVVRLASCCVRFLFHSGNHDDDDRSNCNGISDECSSKLTVFVDIAYSCRFSEQGIIPMGWNDSWSTVENVQNGKSTSSCESSGRFWIRNSWFPIIV